MIIKLTHSKLFTTDPAQRFADTYKVTPDIFKELWRRYRMLEYSISELCELFYIKAGRPMKKRTMDEWMFRARVYMHAQKALDKGAEAVNTDFFGELEERLVSELFENLKRRKTNSIKVLA